MTEEQLLQTAARLGSDVVAGLDTERIAQTVLARLATEPAEAVRPVRRMAPRVVAILAAAAAILLVIRLSVGTVLTSPTSPTAPTSLSVLHELDDLNAAELQALLETLPAAATSPAHPDPVWLDQLYPQDLERLLRSLEG